MPENSEQPASAGAGGTGGTGGAGGRGGGPTLNYSGTTQVVSGVQRDYSTPVATQYCAYCNAPLDPFVYFCLSCATPYKSPMSIVGPARPVPLTDADRVRRLAPHTWTVFWTYAAVVLGAAILSLFWAFGNGPSPVAYFLTTLAIFITTIIFAVIHWRPLKAQLSKPGFEKWEAWAGIGALIPLMLLNFAYHSFLRSVLGPEFTGGVPQDLPVPVAVIVFCLFPAVTEEVAFRGLIQYWLEVSLTPTKALLLGSAMFAGLHFSLLSFPYLFLVGIILAEVRRRTGSLYPGMAMHFLHNLVVVVLFRY